MSQTDVVLGAFDAEDPQAAPDPRVAAFARDGYLVPLPLLTAAECRHLAGYLRRQDHPAPADWEKGRAVHERVLYEVATQPSLLSLVTRLLGEDVVLWGASAVERGPGEVHPWHSDIESYHPDGRFVTVWVGLENTTQESALRVISRSHRLGRTVQEVRRERGLRRSQATAEALLEAVREREPDATLVQPDVTNGEALLFDGRLWHGSHNALRWGKRMALLLQYAAADCPVRIPDLTQLDWPFRHRAAPRPPVILVSGTARSNANRLVPAPPPPSKGLPMLVTATHQVQLPLDGLTKPWEAFPGFRGPTRTLSHMSCHASVLAPGHSPHPPHAHPYEELLLPLHGEVEVLLASSPEDPAPRAERLRPGSFAYYAAGQHHTLRNPGTAPVGYLMFSWHAAARDAAGSLGTRFVHHGGLAAPSNATPYWNHVLFEGPTASLGKLHAHLTVLQPGACIDPHVDAYDIAIVVLSGAVEMLGQTVGPDGVAYWAAGESHGIRNVGAEPARYLVFEFHAPGTELLPRPLPLHRALPANVLRLGKNLARPLWNRLRPRRPEV